MKSLFELSFSALYFIPIEVLLAIYENLQKIHGDVPMVAKLRQFVIYYLCKGSNHKPRPMYSHLKNFKCSCLWKTGNYCKCLGGLPLCSLSKCPRLANYICDNCASIFCCECDMMVSGLITLCPGTTQQYCRHRLNKFATEEQDFYHNLLIRLSFVN